MNTPELQERFLIKAIPPEDPRESLVKYKYILDGKYAGECALEVIAATQRVDWVTFYPHNRGTGFERRREGIGTLAHIETLRAVYRHGMLSPAPETFLVSHRPPTSAVRKSHLRAMGIGGARVLPMPLPLNLLRAMRYGMRDKGFVYPSEEIEELTEKAARVSHERGMLRSLLGRALDLLY